MAKAGSRVATRAVPSTRATSQPKYVPGPTDHLTPAFDALNLIPKQFRGTDDFLDVVTWNIRYFHHFDTERVSRVADVLNVLNADVLVLQEILVESMTPVIDGLTKRGAGHYRAFYGSTGGDQRVAIMYDLDWIRAKDDPKELFAKGEVIAESGKDAFPRLPFHMYLTALSDATPQARPPFDFQLVGVHLKSQRGGGEDQRSRAAQRLAEWLDGEAQRVDGDVILIGDWNEPPDAETWKPLHDLESEHRVAFRKINTPSEISHLYYRNKRSLGSRLDLAAVSIAAETEIKAPPAVVRWTALDTLLEQQPKATQIKKFIKEVSEGLSDHMPVVTRFYFSEQGPSVLGP